MRELYSSVVTPNGWALEMDLQMSTGRQDSDTVKGFVFPFFVAKIHGPYFNYDPFLLNVV